MADNVTIKVGTETSGVKTGLAQVREQFASLRTFTEGAMGGLAASFSVAGILSQLGKAAEIGESARALGISPGELQDMGALAKRVGIDMETAGRGARKVWIEAQKALAGDESAFKHFEALGITLRQLANVRGPADMLTLLHHAVQGTANQHVALAAASELVGIKQAGMLQILRLTNEEFDRIIRNTVKYSDATVAASERITKEWGRMMKVAGVGAASWATPILQGLLSIGKAFPALGHIIGGVAIDLMNPGKLFNAKTGDELETAKAVADFKKKLDEIWGKGADEAGGPIGDDKLPDFDKEKAKKDEIGKLNADLAKQERENQLAVLDLEEKLNELAKERAKLNLEAAQLAEGDVEGLRKQVEAAKLLGDIQRINKEIENRETTEANKIEEKRARLRDRQAREKIDAIEDPAQKLEALEKRRAQLFRKSLGEKDEAKRLDAEGEVLDMDREISGLRHKLGGEKERPSQRELVTDSFTRMGLAHGVTYMRNTDPQERSARALDAIKNDTQKSSATLDAIKVNTEKARWEP